VTLNASESKILFEFLERLSDVFGNAGCNDLSLEDTPENRELVLNAEAYSYGDEASGEVRVYNGKIGTMDHTILRYLIHRLGGE
jgi:hypothetical protein